MARIRTIKPEFFESEDVSALPLRARLTWIGLWVHCDNYGRHKDNVKLVKKNVWPLDPVSLAEVEEDLTTLADHGRIVRYEMDGRGYLAVVNWDRHQPIARPGLPKHPAPPLDIPNLSRHDSDEALRQSLSTTGTVDNFGQSGPKRASDTTVTRHAHVNGEQGTGNREQGRDARERASPPPPQNPDKLPNTGPPPSSPSRAMRLGAEGDRPAEGSNPPTGAGTAGNTTRVTFTAPTRQLAPDEPTQNTLPPTQCARHINDPNPPNCGPCADARRSHEAAAAEKRQRVADAPKCRTHRGELAHNCRLCRADQLAAEEPSP